MNGQRRIDKRTPIEVYMNQPEHMKRRAIKFLIAHQDTTGTPQYWGFNSTFSNISMQPFYIMRQNGDDFDYYFAMGNLEDAWAIRATLPYASVYSFKGFHDTYDIR